MRRSVAEGVALVLASRRLTRLVVTDWIGEWTLVRPAKKWAYDHEGPVDVHLEPAIMDDGELVDPTKGFWRSKLVSGLDCSWCVGVWTSALVTVPLPRKLDRVRKPVVALLAVSQGVGMLSQLENALSNIHFERTVYVMEEDSS